MENEFAALVAIDWADQKHVWTMEMPGSSSRESGNLDHTPESVDVWAAELRLRFSGKPIAVALEQSRGPLVFMLTKYEHLVIFPVHPTTLANYRKSFRPSGAKDDPHDAGLLLDILMRHRDKLRRLNPDNPETRTLQFMVEERRKLVHEKTRYSNRLTAHLKMYFPQALQWFDEIGSNIAADFLVRWPTLAVLQRARLPTIERFFIDHCSRNAERNRERLDQIRKAVPATNDRAVVSACSTAVTAWASLLQPLLNAIKNYDEQIDRLARQHPDYALMNSFPGAGPALTPRLTRRSAVNATDIKRPMRSSVTAASRQLLPPAANSDGFIGDGHARSFSGRPSTSGPSTQSHIQSGLANITTANAEMESRGTPPSGHSPSSGSASCFDVGRITDPTMRWLINGC